jgi:hypothetical protein
MDFAKLFAAIGQAIMVGITAKASLDAGQDVTVPVDLVIGSSAGKPLYLKLIVTEEKPVT